MTYETSAINMSRGNSDISAINFLEGSQLKTAVHPGNFLGPIILQPN